MHYVKPNESSLFADANPAAAQNNDEPKDDNYWNMIDEDEHRYTFWLKNIKHSQTDRQSKMILTL